MSCCGNRRQAGHTRPRGHSISSIPAQASPIAIEFEYIGRTALTVMGPLTWRRYRFEQPGAILAIDAQDAGAMIAVPYLRRLGTS